MLKRLLYVILCYSMLSVGLAQAASPLLLVGDKERVYCNGAIVSPLTSRGTVFAVTAAHCLVPDAQVAVQAAKGTEDLIPAKLVALAGDAALIEFSPGKLPVGYLVIADQLPSYGTLVQSATLQGRMPFGTPPIRLIGFWSAVEPVRLSYGDVYFISLSVIPGMSGGPIGQTIVDENFVVAIYSSGFRLPEEGLSSMVGGIAGVSSIITFKQIVEEGVK